MFGGAGAVADRERQGRMEAAAADVLEPLSVMVRDDKSGAWRARLKTDVRIARTRCRGVRRIV